MENNRLLPLVRWLILLPAISTFLLLTPGLARSGPGWNDISDEDLAMTSWPEDPEATAVVLDDVGEVEFIGEFDLVFKRYRRIKIFTKGAYEKWGTVKIPYFAKSGSQKVESIEGTTTNLESDGSESQARIDSKSIFDEDVNRSVRQIRFTMPDLRPGSIIEYRYTMHSRGGSFLRSWEFGADQPTRSSEFVATIPDNLEYITGRSYRFCPLITPGLWIASHHVSIITQVPFS